MANIITMLISVIMTLFLPKILGVKEYSYWQLYLFYGTYAMYSSLGWCDGLYLKYGGKEYDNLNPKMISSQFWYLAIYETLFSVILSSVLLFFVEGIDKRFVIILTFVSTAINILRYMLQYILQATNRIKEYSTIIIKGLFYAAADDDHHHSGKITHQINKIDGMQGSVDLYQGGHAVYHGKGYLFIINIQNAGTCGNEEHQNGHRTQEPVKPPRVPGVGNIENNHNHGKGQEHRTQVCQTVCHQRHFQSCGNGQQGVADVHHQNGGKQQNKPGTVLVDHLTADHKQYKR